MSWSETAILLDAINKNKNSNLVETVYSGVLSPPQSLIFGSDYVRNGGYGLDINKIPSSWGNYTWNEKFPPGFNTMAKIYGGPAGSTILNYTTDDITSIAQLRGARTKYLITDVPFTMYGFNIWNNTQSPSTDVRFQDYDGHINAYCKSIGMSETAKLVQLIINDKIYWQSTYAGLIKNMFGVMLLPEYTDYFYNHRELPTNIASEPIRVNKLEIVIPAASYWYSEANWGHNLHFFYHFWGTK